MDVYNQWYEPISDFWPKKPRRNELGTAIIHRNRVAMEGQALRPRSTPMFIVLLCIFVNHCAAISVFAGDRPVAWASRVLGGYEQVSRTNGSEAGECPRVFNFTRDGSTFGFVRNFRHVPDVMPKVGNDLIPFIGPRRTSLTNDESFLDPYHQTILPHRRINADGKECGTSQENSYLYLSKIDLGPEMSGAGCSMVYGYVSTCLLPVLRRILWKWRATG